MLCIFVRFVLMFDPDYIRDAKTLIISSKGLVFRRKTASENSDRYFSNQLRVVYWGNFIWAANPRPINWIKFYDELYLYI